MSEPLSVVMEKQIKEHDISVLLEGWDSVYTAIIQCGHCNEHHHTMVDLDEDEKLDFIAKETDMHVSGIECGWVDGPGFSLGD